MDGPIWLTQYTLLPIAISDLARPSIQTRREHSGFACVRMNFITPPSPQKKTSVYNATLRTYRFAFFQTRHCSVICTISAFWGGRWRFEDFQIYADHIYCTVNAWKPFHQLTQVPSLAQPGPRWRSTAQQRRQRRKERIRRWWRWIMLATDRSTTFCCRDAPSAETSFRNEFVEFRPDPTVSSSPTESHQQRQSRSLMCSSEWYFERQTALEDIVRNFIFRHNSALPVVA